MKLCWKEKDGNCGEVHRKIRANDSKYNTSFRYAILSHIDYHCRIDWNNYISTSKYSVFTFIPKNLFEQFQRLANTYFLVLLILQLIPEISSLTPLTTIIPLIAVLTISAIKDAVDDWQRHQSDNKVNNRLSWVLLDGGLMEERWHKIVVGDVIKLENNHFVTADILILSSSEPNSLCYVETAELDGETNLKVLQALPVTGNMDDVESLSMFDGEITCEPPNNNLNNFEGVLHYNNQSFSLNNNNVLLRGCIIRNTAWCFGLVIFAGRDTKLMMNSGKGVFKRTSIDRLMNLLIIGIFILLLVICFLCSLCRGFWEWTHGYQFQHFLPWESFVPGSFLRAGSAPDDQVTGGMVVSGLLVFLSYFIVLNTLVPISLYVSMEMIRFGHSWWINWDKEMYYTHNETPARSRTTTLNEELGQIKYIFSDKTGTLTQNIMSFMKCSINASIYGYTLEEVRISEKARKVDFSDNPLYEPSFKFYDPKLWEEVKAGNPHVHMFFRLIALCHTVMSDTTQDQLEYKAQSPDEGALVKAARNFGFIFKDRTINSITIEVMGHTEVHELLAILDFNNDRKRMSVILKKDSRITLYCKGADSTVFKLLHKNSYELMSQTSRHLSIFAQNGLRTLVCAFKEVDPHFYEVWSVKFHEASISLTNRSQLLDKVYSEIENGMFLIGATAIEDKLQDGVSQTISSLINADFKIWLLTGDKIETALNIGYSCGLLKDDLEEMFVIDEETEEGTRKMLEESLKYVTKGMSSSSKIFQEKKHQMLSFINNSLKPSKESESTMFNVEVTGNFALVISGVSLAYALSERNEDLFCELGTRCVTVICCRVTPLQKAMVVDLVKKKKKAITLAIGDGANDVSMIRAAHIGVGLSGQEGMQAVLSSDFSLAQFRFLERLLLVHGRWSYLRMCKFLRYFFYKNFAFTFCHVWYAFFCGFSAQTLYDEAFISLYNICYTSLPILALGIFEQDVNAEYSLAYPNLYMPGHDDLFFNKKVFALSVSEGILSSLVLFFVPYFSFHNAIKPNGHDLSGQKAFGTIVASSLIVTVTLRCALDTWYWTGFNHFVIWGSIIFYFGFTFIFYSELFDYTYLGTSENVMGTTNFLFTLILVVTILLLPVVVIRFFKVMRNPTLTDLVRQKQKDTKWSLASNIQKQAKRRAGINFKLRQRSGYAFSHQEGFGNIIMSGIFIRSGKSQKRVSSAIKFLAIPSTAVVGINLARDRIDVPAKEKKRRSFLCWGRSSRSSGFAPRESHLLVGGRSSASRKNSSVKSRSELSSSGVEESVELRGSLVSSREDKYNAL